MSSDSFGVWFFFTFSGRVETKTGQRYNGTHRGMSSSHTMPLYSFKAIVIRVAGNVFEIWENLFRFVLLWKTAPDFAIVHEASHGNGNSRGESRRRDHQNMIKCWLSPTKLYQFQTLFFVMRCGGSVSPSFGLGISRCHTHQFHTTHTYARVHWFDATCVCYSFYLSLEYEFPRDLHTTSIELNAQMLERRRKNRDPNPLERKCVWVRYISYDSIRYINV